MTDRFCKICGDKISIQSTSGLCRKCAQKACSEKRKKTMLERYGVANPMESKEFVNKIRTTMLERYGADCAMNVPQFKQKCENTMLERYGESYYVNTDEFLSINQSCKSITNKEWITKVEALGWKVDTERRFDDKRFDLLIEDIKTVIEIDPTYTHNSAGSHWDPNGVDRKYQLVKTLIAEKYGYRCIHVFDWDDDSKILSLLKPKKSIHARKCKVQVVEDIKIVNQFIDANHLQGQCKGTKVALGLYYDNELVEIMTFGSPRYNRNYKWELLRLCTLVDIRVVGGAAKLFNYATNQLKLDSIISYCDRAKFSGRVYSAIGMKKLRTNEPQEVWSKGNRRILGSSLRQHGYDQIFKTNYGKGSSNEQLMLEHGWLPVYDCGQIVYVFGEPISQNNEASSHTPDIDYSRILHSIEKSKEKKCAFCGELFVPVSNKQIYCKRPHYMNCPVCGKQYLVTNNENLKRPPVACSYACRVKRTQQTSLAKYGMKAPGNNPEAREKAKKTMIDKYGAEYTLQSVELKERVDRTVLEKYGVDNVQKNAEIREKTTLTLLTTQRNKLPIKLRVKETVPPFIILDDNKLAVYKLRDVASTQFLKHYGFNQHEKRGKFHVSFGLVNDGMLYQVIRFEKHQDTIYLSDFGTREGYFIPGYYAKLIKFATQSFGVDKFITTIPKYIAANAELVNSLKVTFVKEELYDVFWVKDNEIKKMTLWDNPDKMLQEYDYFTTDYKEIYQFG